MKVRVPKLATVRARFAGRSFWVARFRDGKEIAEWQLDWSLLPRKGLIEVRLHCPNGQVAVLGNSQDLSDRAFQMKTATVSAALHGGKNSHRTDAHIIGMLTGTGGQCTLYSWEYGPRRLVGPLEDRWDMLAYGMIRNLSADHVGAKPD